MRLIQLPAEDVDPPDLPPCDLAFTSPPYFTKEHYSDEPTQSWLRYPTADDWRSGFLERMLALQFAALKPGAINAINIADVLVSGRLVPLVQWTIDAAEAAGFERVPSDLAYSIARVPGGGEEPERREPLLVFRRGSKPRPAKSKPARVSAPRAPVDVVSSKPVVELHEGVSVVRDDLIEGGSKVRALPALLTGADEFVYASPSYGHAQLAIARVAVELGVAATIFLPERNDPLPVTRAAARFGAKLVFVPNGRLSICQARARQHCELTGAVLLPFGLDDERMVAGLADAAGQLDAPGEAWLVGASGTMARALARAWPAARLNVVRVGKRPTLPEGARLWEAPEDFAQPAAGPLPPVPSAMHYDAKAWRFIAEHATPGALFWNVAGEPTG